MKTKRAWPEKGSVIIGSALFVIVMSFIVGNYLLFVSSSGRGVKKLNDQTKAFYIAEAGLNRMFYETNHSGPTSVTATLSPGSYTASIASNTITSVGTVNGISKRLSVTVGPAYQLPPGVKGAVTAHASVSTLGNISIDGREHSINGSLTGAPGLDGINTTGSYTQGGSSTTGGNGYAPANPANPASYHDSQPASSVAPWDILGVSQAWYNSNIPVAASPPSNFWGKVRYSPPGGSWNGVELGISGGVLIVHNDTYTAEMKNIHGIFIGLIISDVITHINGDALIIGAVVLANQGGNTIGNGNALVGFSSSALTYAGSVLGNTSGWVSSPNKTLKSGTWREGP